MKLLNYYWKINKIDVNTITKIFDYKIDYDEEYNPNEDYDPNVDDFRRCWKIIKKEKREEKSFSSPLHLAVKKENLELIILLVNHKGIDLNAKDEQGKIPFDYASTEEIKQLLK